MLLEDAADILPRDDLGTLAAVGVCRHAWGRAKLVALFGSAVLALLVTLVVGFAEFVSQT